MSKDTFTLEQIKRGIIACVGDEYDLPEHFFEDFEAAISEQEPKFSAGQEAEIAELSISLPEEIQVGDIIAGIDFRPEGGQLQWVQVEPGVWKAVMSDEYNNGQEGDHD